MFLHRLLPIHEPLQTIFDKKPILDGKVLVVARDILAHDVLLLCRLLPEQDTSQNMQK